MPSAWIATRIVGSGRRRYRVMYRVGGRESAPRYAGSFATKREALLRKAWVVGELAAMRVPDRRRAHDGAAPTVAQVAARWQASRVDVAAGTLETYRVALSRVLPRLGSMPIVDVDAETVAALVADLHASGLKRQTIRKTVSVLAMALDHARIQPNPARDRLTVKLPREERRHVEPPSAAHVDAAVRLLPRRYRLAVLVLDATGSRCARATDRHSSRRVFEAVTSERLRTALTRACTAAGVPAFSPHDLRHRRVSLLHLAGMPWARIGELVGHDDLVTTARTYTHVVADERELDYAELLI